MKRKLIQIGDSTLLLSVPREWVVANSLMKGDEIEIGMEPDKLTVWCDSRIKKDKLSIDVTEYADMLPRLVYALYKMGIDEVELIVKQPILMDSIKSVVWRETVGFEIIEQGTNHCKVISVSGKIDDFQQVLRRLFLVTLTMGEEMQNAFRKNLDFSNVFFLEQENNRLATVLARAINKYGSYGFRKVGPLYYVVQELEKIGDQYKYMALALAGKRKPAIRAAVLKALEEAQLVMRGVYEMFYTFNPQRTSEVRKTRQSAFAKIKALYSQKPNENEAAILHHSLNIATKSFDLTTSIMILKA